MFITGKNGKIQRDKYTNHKCAVIFWTFLFTYIFKMKTNEVFLFVLRESPSDYLIMVNGNFFYSIKSSVLSFKFHNVKLTIFLILSDQFSNSMDIYRHHPSLGLFVLSNWNVYSFKKHSCFFLPSTCDKSTHLYS